MEKSDIQKLGCCATGDENWKTLQDILTVLWDKAFPDLTKSVCGKKEITLRVARYEYSNGCDMVSIFNEIAQRINFFEGENK